jgi:serine/threonine protein kinase/tetratricopeptide (TPR) repeat protein
MDTLTGQIISHYHILDKLGEGGMGVVYKAEDTLLNRYVAIKFLSPRLSGDAEDRKRFLREARAAAALDHPNICTIHEVDETPDGEIFIVMAAYDGLPLNKMVDNGPLKPEEITEYAIQIAEGLRVAHEKEIVHRDLKPSNIILTESGRIKIMDFGLARITRDSELSVTGKISGTIPYMSPEQARGEQIDHRSDIWSLGVVLYEMATGRHPFRADFSEAVVYSILNSDPEPISRLRSDVPVALERIIGKAMQKNPGDRYQDSVEMLTDLRILQRELETGEIRKTSPEINERIRKRYRNLSYAGLAFLMLFIVMALFSPYGRQFIADLLGRNPIPAEKGLAILPFLNISGDPDDQALCDGFMETLASTITQMEITYGSLWVVPTIDIRSENINSVEEARRSLGVTLVLTGSVHRMYDTIHITLNLVNSSTRRQLRSWDTESDIINLAGLRNDMIVQVAQMLELELRPHDLEQFLRGTPKDPRANELYLQARGHLQRYDNIENISQAVALFTRAASIEPDFALAYAGLGEAYWRMYEETRDRQSIDRAIRNCMRSLELDNRNASAHITLGMIRQGTGEYEQAVESFQRAIDIDPVNSEAHRGLARAFEALGRLDEAEHTFLRSVRLRPNYWAVYNSLGGFYIRHSRYDEAGNQFRRVIDLTPDNARGYSNLGAAYHYLNQLDRAEKYYREAIEIAPDHPDYIAVQNLATLYYSSGRYDEAARMYEMTLEFNDKDYVVWGNLANAYYWAPGEREKAQKTYERAIELAEESKSINPHDPGIIISLAGYYAMTDDRERAFTHLREALTMAPNDAWIMYYAGTTYEQLGERENALHWIEQALRNDYSKSEVLSYPGLRELIADERFEKIIQDIPD